MTLPYGTIRGLYHLKHVACIVIASMVITFIPCTHCVICRSIFVCMVIANNFVNLGIVAILFSLGNAVSHKVHQTYLTRKI